MVPIYARAHKAQAAVTAYDPARLDRAEPDFWSARALRESALRRGRPGPVRGSYFRYHRLLAILPSSSRDYRDLHRARKPAQNQTGRTARTLSGLEYADVSLISAGKS